MIRKCNLALLVLTISAPLLTGQSRNTRKDDKPIEILIEDHLHHPFFWWPETLVSYPLPKDSFQHDTEYSLTDPDTGKPIPFQFAEDDKGRTTLNFFADLPSGKKRRFRLTPGRQIHPEQTVASHRTEDLVLMESNKMAVKIPAKTAESGAATGPVAAISRNGGEWLGRSHLSPGRRKLRSVSTVETASGPVFSENEITYIFDKGATYKVSVRCITGYDFIEITESTTGLHPSDSVSWVMEWSGFHPTHRQAPNHPYGQPGPEKGFARYKWETIDQKKLNYHHGIMPEEKNTGKIPFEVGIYEPWPAERTLTSTLFWDEISGQSLGLFLTDAAQWNDQDYAIWHSSKLQNIRFYYRDKLLSWHYPVIAGKRATAISLYPHQLDIDMMNRLEEMTKPVPGPLNYPVHGKISQLSYNSFLQNRYGTLHLNKVKDWVLAYPDTLPLQPVIFRHTEHPDKATFLKNFLSSQYNTELTLSGTRQNSGYSPVPARAFNDAHSPSFNKFYPELTAEEKARTAAFYLLHSYIAAEEEYMPMRYMLSGHPNFLGDVKSIPGLAAYQFPHHPKAGEWGDLFEKYIELNTRYHTRPSVKEWDATGGRWTENLGTYVWAFLRPTLRTAFLLRNMQGTENCRIPTCSPLSGCTKTDNSNR